MPATFSRVKDWIAEILTYEDLNAEIDNILENLEPQGIGDYSENLGEMQLVTDPYPGGTPSLPNSLAEEIRRLRFQILAILGPDADFWYENPSITLSILTDLAYGQGLPDSRLEAGEFTDIVPDGASNEATISEDIVFWVEGVSYQPAGPISVTGLTAAPGSNNTCLVNDTAAADQHSTTYASEHGTVIPVDTVGSEISSRINTLQAFKINNGSTTEYFIAEYVNDATLGTCLTRGRRGMFFDSVGAPISRIAYSNNDTITLCRLAWVFVTTSFTPLVSYSAPIYSFDTPPSPNIGDLWFDLTTTNWKLYSPSGWELSAATYVGMVVIDGSNAVAARLADPFRFYGDQNEVDIEVTPGSVAEIRQKNLQGKLNVYSRVYNFGYYNKTWSTASDLVTGSVANNTTYYVYVKDDGDCVLDTIAPHERRGDLGGYYYPTEKWRCLGYCTTNGSAQLLPATIVSFSRMKERNFFSNGIPSNTTGTAGHKLFSQGTTGSPTWASGVPTVQKFTSGSGTYTTPTNCLWIEVEMVGAGGGGGGSLSAGGTGGNTTFGTTLLVANGGAGGGNATNAGNIGGTASLGTGPVGNALQGGSGQNPPSSATNVNNYGGNGGASALGGAGLGGGPGGPGAAGPSNAGGGGGGAGGSAAGTGACGGGGSGGYIKAIITSPLATYAYAVGAAGAAGGAGGGWAGGAGGSGIIIVTEHY